MHKYHEVIQAWLNGETIQYSFKDQNEWKNYTDFTILPNFENDALNWRITPAEYNKLASFRYKIFIFKNGFGYYSRSLLDDETKTSIELIESINRYLKTDSELDDKLIFQSDWLHVIQ